MLTFLDNHLLTMMLAIPMVGSVVVLLLPESKPTVIRYASIIFSLIPLCLAVYAWIVFSNSYVATPFKFEEMAAWFPAIGSSYHLGVDGLSLSLVMLTTILIPLALLASFPIQKSVRIFFSLFLFLETGILGVFMALDLILFFLFWEIGLVPMYFLINQWGGENRNKASLKFILITMAGSIGLLLAIQAMGVITGTFDYLTIVKHWTTADGTIMGLSAGIVKDIAFWAFVLAFAIKVPIWPFHTWLPDAHTEAPTGGSMVLAGLLLKLGAYGFFRMVLPLFPEQAHQFASVIAVLAVISIIHGALASAGQKDFKRLVAYSSINHMGFTVLGIAATASVITTSNSPAQVNSVIALEGAALQMFAHGLSSAAMFFMVGVIYERTHSRDLETYGGYFALVPVFGAFLMAASMASLGLPGFGGFISEFLVVIGSWPILMLATGLSLIGLFFTGVYILKALKKTLFGPLIEGTHTKIIDMTTREWLVISPLVILSVVTGVWPAWILSNISNSIKYWFGG